jgi:hypothetical protein
MTFDMKSLTPKPNNWFQSEVTYEGLGRATFSSPAGVVEGHTKIEFSADGDSLIEMTIDKIETEQPLLHGTRQFFDEPGMVGEMPFWTSGSLGKNPCVELVVSTSSGTFSTVSVKQYSPPFWDNKSIKFYPQQSQFDVTDCDKPKYWALPLANFLSDFMDHYSELDRHPLRAYPTPFIPEELEGDDARNASMVANQKNRLIGFLFNAAPAFIEPLANYEECKAQLLSGASTYALTSVMVGEIGENSIDLDDLEQWFPFDFLRLLGFVTGIELGAPWVEFRDSQGRLVRRAHVKQAHPRFSRGKKLIDEGFHRGTGHLLTGATSSEHWNRSYTRVALKNIIRGGAEELTVEDRFSHLCRGIDGLCEYFQLNKPLYPDEVFKKETSKEVKTIIESARNAIDQLANKVSSSGDNTEAEALKQIASQIAGALIIRKGFGKSLLAMLELFDLPDGQILARHFSAHQRIDNRRWDAVLSYYRGQVMHRSYLDFRSGQLDIMEVVRLSNHLHDILARVMLKMLNYDGHYDPPVSDALDDQPVDWVKEDTSASRLGYK